jgi:hypothetical protein
MLFVLFYSFSVFTFTCFFFSLFYFLGKDPQIIIFEVAEIYPQRLSAFEVIYLFLAVQKLPSGQSNDPN